MKLCEQIKTRRKELSLTQEQLAQYLGVSAAAISKWECGSSMPDLLLLSPLARALKTDVNTLLSFHQELSENEIGALMNQWAEQYAKEGFSAVYEQAMDKIREYPFCAGLLLSAAGILDALLLQEKSVDTAQWENEIGKLYERVLELDDRFCREKALSALMERCMRKGELLQAEKFLDQLAREPVVEKKEAEARLLEQKGELWEATVLQQERIMQMASRLQGAVTALVRLALKEQKMERAYSLAMLCQRLSEVLGLWRYGSYVALLDVYMARQDTENTTRLFLHLLEEIEKPWHPERSLLYDRMRLKPVSKEGMQQLKERLIKEIGEEKELAFLRDDERFQHLLEENRNRVREA